MIRHGALYLLRGTVVLRLPVPGADNCARWQRLLGIRNNRIIPAQDAHRGRTQRIEFRQHRENRRTIDRYEIEDIALGISVF
jgi:hypothetical protein